MTKPRPASSADIGYIPSDPPPCVQLRNSAPHLTAALEALETDHPPHSPHTSSLAPSSDGPRGDLSEVSIDFGESTLLHGTAELTHLGLAGYLNMREHGPGIHRMKRYYCRLVGVLFYRFYTKESARDLTNAHLEKEIVKIEDWDGKGVIHRYSYSFKLVTAQGTYNVNADSEEEKTLWKQYAIDSIDAAAMQMRDCSLLPRSVALLAASPGGLTLTRPNKEKEKPPKFKGVPNCMHPTCKVRFDNTKRQHHCRNCGDSVCSDHSYHFAPLPHLPTMTGPQRQCTRCFRVHRFMQHMRTMLQVFVKHRHGRRLNVKRKPMTDEQADDVERMRAAVNELDFGISDAIQALHLHRKDSDEVYFVIVSKLLKLSVTHLPDFDFFLPQLFHLWITMEYDTQLVKWMLLFRVLMTAATYHIRLATSIHWLLRATIDDSCGWGFGQRELGVPDYLKFRFAPCKVAMYNLHMLIDNQSTMQFAPDSDLRTMAIQTELLQVYMDRILTLQEYDGGLNMPTPDLALPSPMNSLPRGGPPPLGPFFNAFAACTFAPHWLELPYRPRNGPRDPVLEQQAFNAQIEFVDKLGGIAESLRHCPRAERKKTLPVELEKLSLPTHAYYPLSSCDEPLHRFVHICAKEGTVFTTKARAPTLIWFEVESQETSPQTLWLSQTNTSNSDENDDDDEFESAPGSALARRTSMSQSMDHETIDNVLRDERLLTSLKHIDVTVEEDMDDDDDGLLDVSIKVHAPPLSGALPSSAPHSSASMKNRMRRSGSLCSTNHAHTDELIFAATEETKPLSSGGGNGPPSFLGTLPRSKGSIKLELLPTEAEKLTYEQLETIAEKLLKHIASRPPKTAAALDAGHHHPKATSNGSSAAAAAPSTSTVVVESKHPALGRLTVEAIKESMEKMKKNFLHDDDDDELDKYAFSGREGIAYMLEMQVAHNEQHATWLGSELLHNHLIRPHSHHHEKNKDDHDVVFQNDATLFVCTLKADEAAMMAATHNNRSTIISSRQMMRPSRYPSQLTGSRDDGLRDHEETELQPHGHMDRMEPEKVMIYMQTLQYVLTDGMVAGEQRDDALATWQLLQDQLEVMCDYVREKQTHRQNQVKSMFGEGADAKRKRMLLSSTHASMYKTAWGIKSMIVKSNDDLRQEVLCLQLIRQFRDIFKSAELDLWLYPYGIVATSASTGIIEVILNATSISGLKGSPGYTNLNQHFLTVYGGLDAPAYKTAMSNFVRSMAAYSLVCYILRIKDRHNGNIMLDADGHLIHIDYGFMLGIQPGGRFSLERRVPFKLTTEMVDAMGGTQSEYFREFVTLLIQGFLALRQNQNVDTILMMIAIMARNSSCPCFLNRNPQDILNQTKALFALELSTDQVIPHVMKLVRLSLNSFGYRRYDQFQHMTNDILP
ncbi:Aste57867_561 [Aphanomyces stellatus]|uniref:1-phosphatidylinositol 4-kinase n=1 Tax=Aphanomyces stellatus TaxID=120398 RepID=A0A485K5K7_9STRA|nr:hypothetical protein As57867_000560 [Aphanomyces stellatus]VFT77786.1 Aste57867_561 [Aphanomyces stellatus]